MATKKPHVLIIGAGLGGLALAQALRKQGISFEIFERSCSEDRFQGWAIGIHRILNDLVETFPDDMPPLATTDHFLPLSLPAQITVYAGDSLSPRIGTEDPGDRSVIRANRQRLRSWLATNIDIRFGRAATAVEEKEGSVTVHFRDGTSAMGDIVVGADGVHSAIRQYLFSRLNASDPLNVLPIATIVGEVALHDADFERQLQLGHSGYLVGPGKASADSGTLFVGLNSVNPDGRSGNYYWFVAWLDEAAASLHESHGPLSASKENLVEAAKAKTAYMHPRFREAIEKTAPEGMLLTPLIFRDLEIERLPTGRVTLLGDAAHCMLPCELKALSNSFGVLTELVRGEGGAHALKDSLNLAQAISRIADTNVDDVSVTKLLDDYQAEMLERGALAARLSRDAFFLDVNAGGRHVVFGAEAVEIPYRHLSVADIPFAE